MWAPKNAAGSGSFDYAVTVGGRHGARAGGTIILTTHILEVAERLADRIGIIQHGRLLAEGTLAELRGRAGDSATTSLEDVYLQLVGAVNAPPAGA